LAAAKYGDAKKNQPKSVRRAAPLTLFRKPINLTPLTTFPSLKSSALLSSKTLVKGCLPLTKKRRNERSGKICLID